MAPILMVFASIGCGSGSTPQAGTRVVVGAVVDRTGNNASPTWPDALKLAESLFNEGLIKAGITNYHFEVVIEDSRNTPTIAVSRALALVHDQNAKVMIADSSQNDNALNRTFYAPPPDDVNSLGVPLMCARCTSGSINSATATNTDPVLQTALRNGKLLNFRAIMAAKLEALVLVRYLLKQGDGNGDVNGDGIFKLSLYASNEAFGQATAKDVATYANQLRPRPCPTTGPVAGSGCTDIETLYSPASPNANTYNWNADLAKLTDINNDATLLTAPAPDKYVGDGYPDDIIVMGFAEHYIPFVENYKLNHYTIPVYHFHTFRINSVITALGSMAEGQQGISHIVVDPTNLGMAQLMINRYSHPLAYGDTMFFDAATTFMLALVNATIANSVATPNELNTEQIKAVMAPGAGGGVLQNGTKFNPDQIADGSAILAVKAGPIDFVGASGPMNWDALNNVKQKVAIFHVQNGVYVDDYTFDCTVAVDPMDPMYLQLACPCVSATCP